MTMTTSSIDQPPIHVGPLKRIIIEVAAKHGLRSDQLKPGCRLRSVVRARQEAAYRCHLETAASLRQIGRALGGFDHTAMLYGIRKFASDHNLPLARGTPRLRPRPSTAGRRPPAADVNSFRPGQGLFTTGGRG